MTKKGLVILGSTGSIGKNTLDVIKSLADDYVLVGISCHNNYLLLWQQCVIFKPTFVAITDNLARSKFIDLAVSHNLNVEILEGSDALSKLVECPGVDVVMASVVGFAGLLPCISALRAGKTLLLANKEALVVGGEVLLQYVNINRGRIIPVDSEHSAIFQCLSHLDRSQWKNNVNKLIITASGGPFLHYPVHALGEVSVEQALNHPNWKMGTKISVDSATMMNKVLEVIEAYYLFDIQADKIQVLIHPQSVIHSMVEFIDSSVLAQLGNTDMRLPIFYALTWPQRKKLSINGIDFSKVSHLNFYEINTEENKTRFPCMQLAWQILQANDKHLAVSLNAANEIAVDKFLKCEIKFTEIYSIVSETLERCAFPAPRSIDDLLAIDRESRQIAIHLDKK